MGRRSRADAEAAAAKASEAARTLQQRGQETRNEPEPVERQEGSTSPDRIEKLLGNRPSAQAMDEILAKRGVVDEPEEKPEAKPEAPVEAKAEPEAEKPAESAPPAEVVAEAPKTVRVKVDGEEFDADAKEVEEAGGVRAYQMQRANENRLAKTNSALEETRKIQAQMAGWLQSQAKANQKPEPTDAQFIAERIDKIRFGTPEESAVALQEIMGRGKQNIDPNAIVAQATTAMQRNLAVQGFAKEFQDVVANPLLAKLAVSLEQERMQTLRGPVDWSDFYRKIGNEIRSATGRQSQPATPTDKTAGNTSQPSDKEARKASIVNLPKAAARADMPKEEKEPTSEELRQEWFKDAKKARGQG